jgi:O-glycosyl hydrolase
MESSGLQAADFLVKLYPTVQQSGLRTKIACCDGSGWEQARERIEGIEAAGDEYTIEIATAHGYSSPLSTPFDTTKRVWQSEWADLTGPYTLAWYSNGSTGEGLTWANHIQSAFVVSNVSAFLHWIGAENSTTGNSMLIHLPGDNVIVSKRLWAFAQFSRFVKPDARRIAASSGSPGVNVTVSAFENVDGSVAVQVINNTDEDQTVDIAGLWSGSVKAWLTNNDEDLTEVQVQFAQGGPGGTVQARSMVSYVFSR